MELLWCRECSRAATLWPERGWRPMGEANPGFRRHPKVAKLPLGVCTPCWLGRYRVPEGVP